MRIESFGPWQPLYPARVRSLNCLGSEMPEEFLDFHGSYVKYEAEDFIDT